MLPFPVRILCYEYNRFHFYVDNVAVLYVCMYVFTYVCIYVYMYLYMYVCMYLCMYACMYVLVISDDVQP
jgi:hypothetical protein